MDRRIRLDEPAKATKQRRSSLAAAAVVSTAVAVVALAAALWLWRSKNRRWFPGHPIRSERSMRSVTISPDGRHIAYLAGKDRSLWIQDLDQNDPRSIAGTTGAQRPFWSPDSAFIAFAVGGQLLKMPVAGGPPYRFAVFLTRSS